MCCAYVHEHTDLVGEAKDGECIEKVLPCGWVTGAVRKAKERRGGRVREGGRVGNGEGRMEDGEGMEKGRGEGGERLGQERIGVRR